MLSHIRNYIAVAMLALLCAVSPAHADGLFGMREIENGDLSAFTKWGEAQERQAHAVPTAEIKVWQKFVDGLRGKSKAEQLRAVNSYMNKVRYISDMANYGKSDYWATLAALGFDVNDMRVVILFDKTKAALKIRN